MRSELRLPSIWPTRSFIGLAFLLAAIWYAGASQNNSAAYVLLFLLGSVVLISVPHTITNVTGLTATAESLKPTFAGQEAALPIEVANPSRTLRSAIVVSLPESETAHETIDEIAPGKAARVTLRFQAEQRGEQRVESFCVSTVYPLGFLRSAKHFATDQRYIVYPRPAGDTVLPHPPARGNNATAPDLGEGDDFAGVRAYIPGESQRHIDWKAVARGQAMMTKQFVTEAAGMLHLDFGATRFSDTEDRLSQLALWVIEAERVRRPYGLRLPGVEIAPALGDAHFHRCLRTLALFA
jgi:uncharacterized protein (DUF58 family)